MAHGGRSDGLRTIFAIFLGLMVTAFVGVGVYTFYPPPEGADKQIRELSHREEEIRSSRPQGGLTAADQEEIRQINRQRDALFDAAKEAYRPFGRTTSIILIAFATLAMAVSMVRADQLPVISSGLLLGGVFTMLYGIGWVCVTDTSVARFVVVAVALAITLGLGYLRYVRCGAAAPPTVGAGAPGSEAVLGLERRLRDLEERLDLAAEVLGRARDGAGSGRT
jgi:hypothetical protein